MKNTIAANKIPLNPALTIFPKFIPAPIEKPINGITMPTPVEKNFLTSTSRFPKIKPIIRGIIAANNDINGILASPEAPNVSSARKGPSCMFMIPMAAASAESPYSPIKERYKLPFAPVTELIIARTDTPINPAFPNILLIAIPRSAPAAYLAINKIAPLLIASGTSLTFKLVPIKNICIPTTVATAVLEKSAVVKDPILRALGATVFINAPMSSGTTIIPPGTFWTVFIIFILLTPQ